MILLLLVLTLFNTLAIAYLIGVVTKLSQAVLQDRTISSPPSQPLLSPAQDAPGALVVSVPENLTPAKEDDALAPEEVAKIDMRVRQISPIKEWYDLEVYNGTDWRLKEVIVNFTALKDGKEVLSRNYKVDGYSVERAEALSSFNVERYAAFALEEGQKMTVRVVSARKQADTK